MNRAVLPVALALILSGSVAFAQQAQPQPSNDPATSAAPTHARNPHRQTMKLAKELNLTPDQRAKVEPILASRDQQINALKTNNSIAPTDFRKQMRTIQQSTRQQLNSVLTPDQIQQFKSIQQGRRNKSQPATPAPAV